MGTKTKIQWTDHTWNPWQVGRGVMKKLLIMAAIVVALTLCPGDCDIDYGICIGQCHGDAHSMYR